MQKRKPLPKNDKKLHIAEHGDEKEIYIISPGKDGAELKREQQRNGNFIMADGKTDTAMLQDAINEAGSGKVQFSGLGDSYDRIFGGQDGRRNSKN